MTRQTWYAASTGTVRLCYVISAIDNLIGFLIYLFQSSYLCEDDMHVDCMSQASRGCCHGACGDMDPYRYGHVIKRPKVSY